MRLFSLMMVHDRSSSFAVSFACASFSPTTSISHAWRARRRTTEDWNPTKNFGTLHDDTLDSFARTGNCILDNNRKMDKIPILLLAHLRLSSRTYLNFTHA